MGLDAIIISDPGETSMSGTNPLRLRLEEKPASLQLVLNYLENQGSIIPPVKGEGEMSWSTAPKLNGIYLLSYLTRNNFNAELINHYYEEREVFRKLLERTPKAVIISTTFVHSKQALKRLVDDIRSLAPGIYVIVGGPFIYLSYLMLQKSDDPEYETDAARDDFLFLNVHDEPHVDLFIVSLRGGPVLCEALKTLKGKNTHDGLPNSARFSGKTYGFTKRIDDVSGDNELSIDWDSLPDSIFRYGVVPMQASNGCPYRCAFCNFVKDPRLSFVKPTEQIIAEMRAVSNRGVKYVWFSDDNFRLGKDDLDSVCRRFVEEDIGIRWMSFIRAGTLKDFDLELLKKSGCTEVQLGLESADPQVLQNMNKKARPELYTQVVEALLGAGINCSCYFIFGFPGETIDSVVHTREFIKSIEHPELDGMLSWSIFPFILSPLSPIYEYGMRKKYGLSGYMHNWKHGTMNFKQAMEHVKTTFLELKDSGPIFRGDNLNLLLDLSPRQSKEFAATRHRLSKLQIKSELSKNDILEAFSPIFSNTQ